MLLLVLHDAISVFLGDHEAYTVALITVKDSVKFGNESHFFPSLDAFETWVNFFFLFVNQLLMLRTAGIVIPVYIILVSVTELLHRRNQMQVCGTLEITMLDVS